MSISHAIHSLIAKLGSEICVVSEADGKQVHITGLIQNDTGKTLRDCFSYVLRGRDPGHLYTLIATPNIPFDLDSGAKVTQNGKCYQILAHRYFREDTIPVYLYALLAEEVSENELL
ncbi:MAG TPA: hypothetical protein H9662_10050 [Firmicutes bacterium]|nr:hypothetical protein [Bacillota bacterium]